jgi:glucose-6-phosphate isomerase
LHKRILWREKLSFSPTVKSKNSRFAKTITKEDIASIKKQATLSEIKRARICLHKDHNDPVQEMFIVLCKGTYIPPHRQKGLYKTYYLYEGELDVLFFEDQELVKKIVFNKEKPIIHLKASVWHTVLVKSDLCIYTEVIAGPYEEGRTEFADWAPQRSNCKDGLEYLGDFYI